jgi:hypothetical protein
MELNEQTYTLKDTIEAAQRVLDQAIIQKNGINVFEELGFGYASELRMYVTDDRSRLTTVVHQITRDGRTYFLGGIAKK